MVRNKRRNGTFGLRSWIWDGCDPMVGDGGKSAVRFRAGSEAEEAGSDAGKVGLQEQVGGVDGSKDMFVATPSGEKLVVEVHGATTCNVKVLRGGDDITGAFSCSIVNGNFNSSNTIWRKIYTRLVEICTLL